VRCFIGWSFGVAVLSLAAFPVLLAADEKKKEPGKFEISKEERVILDLTNEARKEEKLPPLKPNPTLFKVARAHSANMGKQGVMEHKLDDKTPAQRVKAAGYNYSWVGENIAMSSELIPEEIFDKWMHSKVHRDNVLKPQYKEIGIGVVKNDKGEWYYTQVFGARRGQ
jgi:uncharacterized protein YkwD